MPTVHIEGFGVAECVHGRRLVLCLEDAGVDILHRCGGNARCATCRVVIEDGEAGPHTGPEVARLAHLTDQRPALRLSCQVRVTDDLRVKVVNRLHEQPELGDAGPRPIEWPADRSLPPDHE